VYLLKIMVRDSLSKEGLEYLKENAKAIFESDNSLDEFAEQIDSTVLLRKNLKKEVHFNG